MSIEKRRFIMPDSLIKKYNLVGFEEKECDLLKVNSKTHAWICTEHEGTDFVMKIPLEDYLEMEELNMIFDFLQKYEEDLPEWLRTSGWFDSNNFASLVEEDMNE